MRNSSKLTVATLLLLSPLTANACNVECKTRYLVDEVKIQKEIATSLINTCKNTTKDPVHCIKIGASISMAESSGGLHCAKNGCFGVKSGKTFINKSDGVKDWVTRYNKYWYKSKGGHFFYGSSPSNSATSQYCMSEDSTGTKGWCPAGRKTFDATFEKISKKF